MGKRIPDGSFIICPLVIFKQIAPANVSEPGGFFLENYISGSRGSDGDRDRAERVRPRGGGEGRRRRYARSHFPDQCDHVSGDGGDRVSAGCIRHGAELCFDEFSVFAEPAYWRGGDRDQRG
jgi:hypothetical protein